jgi:hypothetical protein
MNDSIPDARAGAHTEITLRIPEELARHPGTYTLDDLERERRDRRRLGF